MDRPQEIGMSAELVSQQSPRNQLDIVANGNRQTAERPSVHIRDVNHSAGNRISALEYNSAVAFVSGRDRRHNALRFWNVWRSHDRLRWRLKVWPICCRRLLHHMGPLFGART